MSALAPPTDSTVNVFNYKAALAHAALLNCSFRSTMAAGAIPRYVSIGNVTVTDLQGFSKSLTSARALDVPG